MGDFYMLIDGEIVQTDDIHEWGDWFENSQNRIISKDTIGLQKVSTVFLGIDHAFMMSVHRPILFETMIFEGPHDGYQVRYCTLDEAKAGHAKIVDDLISGRFDAESDVTP